MGHLRDSTVRARGSSSPHREGRSTTSATAANDTVQHLRRRGRGDRARRLGSAGGPCAGGTVGALRRRADVPRATLVAGASRALTQGRARLHRDLLGLTIAAAALTGVQASLVPIGLPEVIGDGFESGA